MDDSWNCPNCLTRQSRPLVVELPVEHGRTCHVCYAPLTGEQIASGVESTPAFDADRLIPPKSTIEWMPEELLSGEDYKVSTVVADMGDAGVLIAHPRVCVPNERILAIYAC